MESHLSLLFKQTLPYCGEFWPVSLSRWPNLSPRDPDRDEPRKRRDGGNNDRRRAIEPQQAKHLLCCFLSTRSLSEAAPCRFQRGVNNNGDPYPSRKENQSTIEVFLLPENRVESMLAPEGSDGINQEIKGNWGKCDEDCDCCVGPRDIFLNEGCRTCDEKGVDGGYLVVERVFHAFRGMEYENS